MENSINKNAENNIMVSVLCLAYNHASYIRNALDGFVNQKTNFKYEVIIHDDASTDGTANIIREYAEKYPDLFVPILQRENMHSKKVKITPTFLCPKVRGKYIAFCEGDDFWMNENKLQKQIDFLENHPEYTACTHACKVLDMRDNTEKEKHAFNYTGTVTVKQVIEGDGDLFATGSVVAKAEEVINRKPFREIAGVGDYPLIIQLALAGKVYYFDEVMSCYRFMAPGSWNSMNMVDDEKRKLHIQKIQACLEEADRYSEYKYHDSFSFVIDRKWFNLYFKKMPMRKLKKRYRAYYCRLTIVKRLVLYFRASIPLANKIIKLAQKNNK